jgi:hypothetical protein
MLEGTTEETRACDNCKHKYEPNEAQLITKRDDEYGIDWKVECCPKCLSDIYIKP